MPDATSTAMRLLAQVARRVGSSLALDETLVAVAESVVEALGFRAAVVNLTGADDRLHVVAIAGSDEIKQALSGTSSSRESWQRMLAVARPIGELRFLMHGTPLPSGTEDMRFYVPDIAEPSDDCAQRWHPLDALFAPLRDRNGELLGILSVDDPVDGLLPSGDRAALLEAFAVHAALAIEHAREHAETARSEALLRRLFDGSPVPKALLDSSGRIINANLALSGFLGRQEDELIGQTPMAFTHPDDNQRSNEILRAVASGQQHMATLEKRYIRPDGDVVLGRLTLTPIVHDGRGQLLATVEDITEARAAGEQLQHMALHDSLTQLPNRTLIADRLEQALARSRRDGTNVGLAVVDLDHFKLVNDSYGHRTGDRLLVAVAESVKSALRAADTAGRLGGDELIVICEDVADVADLHAVAERLRAAARVTLSVDGVVFTASASVGCTLSRPEADAEELVAEADSALYRAKSRGRGRCEVFDEQMRRDSVALLHLRGELNQALERDEFRLHYQPIVDAGQGQIVGFEALLRWQHPTRGLLLPGEFLDVVAESELDHPITRWVIQHACADLDQLGAVAGDSSTYVSVNLSPRQLGRAGIVDDIRSILRQSDVDPLRLWLEVTEQQAIEANRRQTLQELHELGCRIVIDDFGTGYCGLAYLQQLPVQVLKIDRQFVARMTSDRVSAGITTAVVDLADVLDITVVAEGVETDDQVTALTHRGVRFMQGYLFARPAPLEHWVATTPSIPRQRLDCQPQVQIR